MPKINKTFSGVQNFSNWFEMNSNLKIEQNEMKNMARPTTYSHNDSKLLE